MDAASLAATSASSTAQCDGRVRTKSFEGLHPVEVTSAANEFR
ncbi:hypothetical protein PI125_g1216 [Phytophthora idaei]|nr:hypothetical protein PI125_g1216 [Phytophthora idaei]